MAKLLTSREIQTRIDEIDAKLAGFGEVEDRQALAALSGDQSAIDELAANKAEAAGLNEQRALLEKALGTAEKNEADARAAAEAERRDSFRKLAKDAARAVLPHATRVDELLAELQQIAGLLGDLEATIRANRVKAGLDATSGRANSTDFAGIALDQFAGLSRPVYERPAPMSQLVAAGLADLLADDAKEE